MIAVQDPVSHALAERRATGLASSDDFMASASYRIGDEREVGRFADAFDAFQGNESATHVSALPGSQLSQIVSDGALVLLERCGEVMTAVCEPGRNEIDRLADLGGSCSLERSGAG